MTTAFRFFTDITVRYADTDANGHVFFANYLTYFDIALFEYLKAAGYGFDRFTENGVNLYYADAQSRYRAGARFDDVLRVHAAIDGFGTTSFTARFVIHNAKTGQLVNSGHIVVVVVDRKTERKTPQTECSADRHQLFVDLQREFAGRQDDQAAPFDLG